MNKSEYLNGWLSGELGLERGDLGGVTGDYLTGFGDRAAELFRLDAENFPPSPNFSQSESPHLSHDQKMTDFKSILD